MRTKKWLRFLLIILISTSWFYYYGSEIMERYFIYHPEKLEPAEPALWGLPQAEVVEVNTEDGLTLQGWYVAPRSPELPTFVYFHGNAGNRGTQWPTMEPYVRFGYGVFFAEYRGYGSNPGVPSEQGLYKDARAAIQRAQELADEKIILLGESLGSGVAVQMATEFPAAGLILHAPFTSLVAVGKKHYPYLPVDLLLTDRYDSQSKIQQVKMPVVIVHGEADATVPVTEGKILFAEALEPKLGVFLPGVGHLGIPDHSEAIMKFLHSHTAVLSDTEASE